MPAPGTVGPPLPGIELRIAGDGEVFVRGATVFAGYHRDPEATAAVLRDGWFATGDVGELDAEGYLRITDRKKDLIITAGGKNISPSNIEAALTRHPLIANAVVIGDRRPYLSALITIDPTEAAAYPDVRAEVERHVEAVNATLSNVERVRRWTILEHDFTVGDELTPTLKVKRKVVNERYAAEIEANYPATAPSQSGDTFSGVGSAPAPRE